jgi:CPA2 family monovalent cation:H+ antiporter-2
VKDWAYEAAFALPRPSRELHVTRLCAHFETQLRVDPPLKACSACVEIGAAWVHLRQCLTCGQTSCCDQSRNRHATAHFRETGHLLIRTAEPDEDWQWCYLDDCLYVPGDVAAEAAGA